MTRLALLIFMSVCPLASAFAPQGGSPYWIANEGQWEGDFGFKCEVGSAIYYVTPQGMTVDFRVYTRHERPRDPNDPLDMMDRGHERDSVSVRGHVVQIHYVTSGSLPPFTGEGLGMGVGTGKISHYSNYFLGRDSCNWRSRVSHYQTVLVKEVWEGIDVEYRADRQGVETVFHVKPGADVGQVQMEYLGLAAPLRLDSQGNLILETSLGEMKEKSPFAFQQNRRIQESVGARFRITDENRVGYLLDSYDMTKETVIDPLLYSSLLGGDNGADQVNELEILPSGDILLCGGTGSNDFPSTEGAYQQSMTGTENAFLTILTDGARTVRFSTFFGVAGHIKGNCVEVTSTGDLLLLGDAGALGAIPLTGNAIDTTRGGWEGFAALFSGDGANLLYSSYIGGSANDHVWDADISSEGLVVLTGSTTSEDFPTTQDALFQTLSGGTNAILAVMDVFVPTLVFSSYFGNTTSSADHIDLSDDGSAWISGLVYGPGLSITEDAFQIQIGGLGSADAFLSHIRLTPPENLYTTYFGGDGNDRLTSMEVIGSDEVAMYGFTASSSWVTTPGAYDSLCDGSSENGFVTVFQPPNSILRSTLLGESHDTYIEAGTKSPDGSYLVGGYTTGDDLPITPDALDSTFGPNIGDAPRDLYLLKLASDLTAVEYCTYFGGNDIEHIHQLVMSGGSDVWMIGGTQSSQDFPVTSDALRPQMEWFGWDGFISCIGISSGSISHPTISVPSTLGLNVFPNPFNPTTTLSWTLPRASETEIIVHNLLGQEIERVNLGRLSSGAHEYEIRADEWPSGIYFANLRTVQHTTVTKLMLLR